MKNLANFCILAVIVFALAQFSVAATVHAPALQEGPVGGGCAPWQICQPVVDVQFERVAIATGSARLQSPAVLGQSMAITGLKSRHDSSAFASLVSQ